MRSIYSRICFNGALFGFIVNPIQMGQQFEKKLTCSAHHFLPKKLKIEPCFLPAFGGETFFLLAAVADELVLLLL